MIINPTKLSEALESILRQCLIQCDTSYLGYKNSRLSSTRLGYMQCFDSGYTTLTELSKIVVKDYLTKEMRLTWDKINVYNNDLHNINKPFDVADIVWCNKDIETNKESV